MKKLCVKTVFVVVFICADGYTTESNPYDNGGKEAGSIANGSGLNSDKDFLLKKEKLTKLKNEEINIGQKLAGLGAVIYGLGFISRTIGTIMIVTDPGMNRESGGSIIIMGSLLSFSGPIFCGIGADKVQYIIQRTNSEYLDHAVWSNYLASLGLFVGSLIMSSNIYAGLILSTLSDILMIRAVLESAVYTRIAPFETSSNNMFQFAPYFQNSRQVGVRLLFQLKFV